VGISSTAWLVPSDACVTDRCGLSPSQRCTPLSPHPTKPNAVSDLIELVGVGVTGWFIYRYLTVGPDR